MKFSRSHFIHICVKTLVNWLRNSNCETLSRKTASYNCGYDCECRPTGSSYLRLRLRCEWVWKLETWQCGVVRRVLLPCHMWKCSHAQVSASRHTNTAACPCFALGTAWQGQEIVFVCLLADTWAREHLHMWHGSSTLAATPHCQAPNFTHSQRYRNLKY